MENRITRRDVLKMGAFTFAWMLFGSGFSLESQARTLSYETELQQNVDRLLGQYPFLAPYTLYRDGLALGNTPLTIAVRQPRAAKAGALGIRLCDGAIPTISFVDELGRSRMAITDHQDETPYEAAHLLEYGTPQQLLVPIVGTDELTVNNRPSRTVMTAGDSWTRWGGVEHSVPTMLQRLLSFSGFNTEVVDISSSGVNIANHLAVLKRLKSRHGMEPDTLISTLHATDYAADTQRLFLPAKKQEELLGTAIYRSSPDFSPYKQSLKMGLHALETGFPFLSRFRQVYRENKGGDTRVNMNDEGCISDAGLLSPLNDVGKAMFKSYLSLVKSYASSQADKSHVMMVLPDGLTDDEYSRFDEHVVKPVVKAAAAAAPAFTAFHNHDYPGDKYDAYDHPTPEGSFFLAYRLFQSLTGKLPSGEAINQTWQHYTMVANALVPFRNKLASV